jgi:hypothetical protein
MKGHIMKEAKGYGFGSNAKAPSGVTASDKSGERMEQTRNGVGMGKMDAMGADKKFDGGRTSGVCYTHDRKSCQK